MANRILEPVNKGRSTNPSFTNYNGGEESTEVIYLRSLTETAAYITNIHANFVHNSVPIYRS